jgi:hypothetical protein
MDEEEVDYSNGFPDEAVIRTEDGMIEAELVDEENGLYEVDSFGGLYGGGDRIRGTKVQLDKAPENLDNFASALGSGYNDAQVESSNTEGIEFSDEIDALDTEANDKSQNSELDPTNLEGLDPL